VGVVDRVHDLEVGARLALGEDGVHADSVGLKRGLDPCAGVAGEDGPRLGDAAELLDDLRDVDALAARVTTELDDAVDLIDLEIGNLRGLVKRGVEGNGVDHLSSLGKERHFAFPF
jgi:hypothetical protein